MTTNGWNGLGTEESPYVIENMEVDATGSDYALRIHNTDKYLEIKNCVLSGSDTGGIRFNNVTNVLLKNNTYNSPSQFTYGIYLWTCSNIVVDGNDFGDTDTGVYLERSDNNNIRFNNVSNSRTTGVYLDNSRGNTIANNTCNDTFAGILLQSESDWNVIDGNICNRSENTGISLDFSANNTVSNNTLYACGTGIALYQAVNNTVFRNNCSNGPGGSAAITLDDSHYNIIAENNCSYNYGGIKLTLSDNNTVGHNTILHDISTDVAGNGIEIDSSNNNTISDNYCNGYAYSGIIINSHESDSRFNSVLNNVLSCPGAPESWHVSGIQLWQNSGMVSNNTITGNECFDNYYGIYLIGTTSNAISSNIVHGNVGSGVYLDGSSNCIVSSNTVYDNGDSGIWLDGSSGCTVEYNAAWSNFNGTYFYDSDSNVLSHNELQGNTYGIYLSISSYNTISDNNCSDSVGGDGIQLRTSNFNTLQNNIANDNIGWRGIFLYTSSSNALQNNTCNGNGDGISIYSRSDVFSTDNKIHNNTCVLNTFNGINVQAHSDGTIITNNTCNDNANRGVQISASSDCRIVNNTGLRNEDGLLITSTNIENVIDNNDFSDNTRYGIYIGESIGSSVTNNTCVGNVQMGIRVNNFHSGSIVNNTGNENGVGIYLTSSNDNVVSRNNCSLNTADTGSNHGIWLTSSLRNTITNNTCDQNGDSGIYLGYSNDNVLTNNSCSGNPDAGVFLYYADSSVLHNNTLNANGYGIKVDHSYDLVIVENEIHENVYGMELYGADGSEVIGNNCTAASLMYYQTYGIFLKYCLSVIVLDNDCNYNYVGILNEDSDDIVISDNNCDLNYQTGIELRWALGNVVSNNSCTGNSIGMTVIASEGNTISDNNCSGNVQAGINFYNGDSPNNVICNNTFSNNGYGMWLEQLIDSSVSNNTFNGNGKAAIHMWYSCVSNTITNNIISNNGYQLEDPYGYGMYSAGMGVSIFGYVWNHWAEALIDKPCDGNIVANNTIEGSRLYGLQIQNSFGIRVFGNVFIGNNGTTSEYDPAKLQAFDDSSNFWNDTTYGNLWADWTSPDAESDGIVDVPYLIAGGDAKDYLPLAVSVAINSPADGFVTGDSSVDISGTAVSYFGVDQVTWYNDATSVSETCTGAEDWNATIFLTEGENLITVTMTDLSGNQAHATITLVQDITPPTLEITSPEEGAFTGGSVTVVWTGSDDGSGVSHYNISIDGGAWMTATSPYTFNGLAQGDHVIIVKAFDLAGNNASASVNMTVDATPPNVEVLSPMGGYVNTTGSITITWTGNDTDSGIDHYEVSWEGMAPLSVSNTTLTYTFTGLSDGSHLLTVVAVDKVGLTSQDQVAVVVDTGPPSLTITSPAPSSFLNSGTVTITWAADDAGVGISNFTISRDGGTAVLLGAGSRSYQFSGLSEGAHTVAITATDLLGHSVQVSRTFTVDTVAPTLIIEGPEQGTYFNVTTVTVSWSTYDSYPGEARISLDNGPWTLATGGEFVLNALANGQHTVRVNVTDQAGNFNESSVQFTVDADPPTVTFTSPAEGAYVNTTQGIVEWEASDPTSMLNSTLIRVDGGAWAELGAATGWIYDLEDGEHTIEVKVTDLTGNSATATLNITVDTVAPDAEVSPIGDDLELDLVVLVEFSEQMDIGTVNIELVGVSGSVVWSGNTATFRHLEPLENGRRYTVKVNGTDLAGNEMELSWNFTTVVITHFVGVAADVDGTGISGVRVTISNGTLSESLLTDANGEFSFGLQGNLTGTFTITLEKDGFQDVVLNNVTYDLGGVKELGVLTMTPEAEEDGGGDNTLLYAIVAIVLLVVVAAAAFVYLKKK